VRAETQLVVKNSDPVEHNIHGYKTSELSTQFNFGTAPKVTMSEVAEAFLEDAAKYIVKCDIHPWMSAYVHAVKHPYYAITNESGEYSLENVPPGTYRVVCWHEGMIGTPVTKDNDIVGFNYSKDVEVEKTATVEASKEVVVDFEVPAP
jgi:plastocyanin